MSHKNCISCGIPIRLQTEAAGQEENKPYCHLCSNADGLMKSCDDILHGMTQFIVGTQGLDPSVAKDLAVEMMSKLSAWQ